MYDLARVTTEFKAVCHRAGVGMDAPIRLNSRLTSTLGRVHIVKTNGEWNPVWVEFSPKFLETATDECIHEVILHEAAHWIATSRTHSDCKHGGYFKSVCAEIGTTNDTPHTQVERTSTAAPAFKYDVFCPTCNVIVGHYSRAGRIIKEIDDCRCGRCRQKGLKVIQNW